MTINPGDDEALLDRFRDWLRAARDEAWAIDGGPVPSSTGLEPEPRVGLYRLVEEFTALRHEIKLETKGSRNLNEQVEALLPAIRQAVDQLRSVAPREEQVLQAVARPMAEAIADLDEALERGRLEIEKARDRLAASTASIVADLDAFYASQPWYRRWRHSSYHRQVRELVGNRAGESQREIFAALLEGYGLIQARLRRALDAGQVGRIDCVGRPVDPTRMTVVEAIDAVDQPPGHVVDEVRGGYTWGGRVLRYAVVRAARERLGPPASEGPEVEDEEEDEDEIQDEANVAADGAD
jgi:molecular chaperone GrpE